MAVGIQLPWHGIQQRYKGKMAAAFGLIGHLYVGSPEDNDAAVANSPVAGVLSNYGTPTSGGSGTHANFAPKGSILMDVQNAAFYMNTGTLASPTWTLLFQSGEGTDGLTPSNLKFADFKNTTGSALAASASSGEFGYGITLGTSFALVTEAAEGNTKSDNAICEYVLPASYIPGSNFNVTVNMSISGTGTPGTKTAQIKCYPTTNAGVQSSDIGPGSTQAITAAGADMVFAITGTGLTVGQKLVFELSTVLQETGGSNTITGNVNSVRVS